jgi:uncharacterized protein with FMN-binding domain
MKKAPWLMMAGAVAGFAGVLGLHKAASPAALPAAAQQGGSSPAARAVTPGPSSPAAGPGTALTGPIERYGYGELAVRVTVSGGHVTGLAVPLLKTAEPYSQQLASQVIPMLRNEVLSAQSTSINAVSGATYTSQAYAASVQAALDKLHFK